MAKFEDLLNVLHSNNLVDDRKIAVVANAKALPSGDFGLCLLCLNTNILCVYDTDFQQKVGAKLYEIDLRSISDFKASSFVFNRYMKFSYNAFTWKFADFGNAKEFIDAVSSEMCK